MNNTVKTLLIFTAGLVVGAVAGVLGTKKKYEMLHEELLQEEIASVKERLELKKKRIIEEVESIGEVSAAVTAGKKRNVVDKTENNHSRLVKNLGYTDSDEDEEYREYESKTNKSRADKVRGDIFIITTEQFMEEADRHDKLTIYYYEDDDTLTDENEEVVGDVGEMIGDETLSRFGEGSDDPEIVYVRNNRLEIDYEVIRLSKSYSETVLGYDPSENEGSD